MTLNELTIEVLALLFFIGKAIEMLIKAAVKHLTVKNEIQSEEKEAISLLNETVTTMQKNIQDLQDEVTRLKEQNTELRKQAAKVPMLESELEAFREAYKKELRKNLGLDISDDDLLVNKINGETN